MLLALLGENAYVGTMSIKFSSTFLIWVAAAVLYTLTAVGGHGFTTTWTALSPGSSLSGAVSALPTGAGPIPEPASRMADTRDKFTGVVTALQAGNVDELSRYFDAYVDLTLPDKRLGSYSKIQAKMVLRDFFETNKVKGFVIQSKGEGGTNAYCIGTLQTSGGNFRACLFVRQEGDQPLIKEIDFSAHY